MRRTSFPFNLVVLDLGRITSSSLETALDLLNRCSGTKITEDVFLVSADFMTLTLRLLSLPGCQNGPIKIFCLSAYDGELDSGGTYTNIRRQASSHLLHELQKLQHKNPKLDLSAVLSHFEDL